jgi:putative tryptophan/tyrosine transport system substrate-binding protein
MPIGAALFEDIVMTRRLIGLLITLTLGFLVAPLATDAQPPGKMTRIGILAAPSDAPERVRNLEAFRQGLRDLGWVEGQNLAMEYRSVKDRAARLPDLAAELVQLKVEVMVTLGGNAVTRAAQTAMRTIPIVMVSTFDPVGQGFIASLARPGGNITGTATLSPELMVRRLELLREAVPGVSRIAVLLNRANPSAVAQLHETHVAAQPIGMELRILQPQSPDELASTFVAMTQAGVGALLVLGDPFLFELDVSAFTALAQQHRLPAMYIRRVYVDAGV